MVNKFEHGMVIFLDISLKERLSYKSVKAYMTKSKGTCIIANNRYHNVDKPITVA